MPDLVRRASALSLGPKDVARTARLGASAILVGAIPYGAMALTLPFVQVEGGYPVGPPFLWLVAAACFVAIPVMAFGLVALIVAFALGIFWWRRGA